MNKKSIQVMEKAKPVALIKDIMRKLNLEFHEGSFAGEFRVSYRFITSHFSISDKCEFFKREADPGNCRFDTIVIRLDKDIKDSSLIKLAVLMIRQAERYYDNKDGLLPVVEHKIDYKPVKPKRVKKDKETTKTERFSLTSKERDLFTTRILQGLINGLAAKEQGSISFRSQLQQQLMADDD